MKRIFSFILLFGGVHLFAAEMTEGLYDLRKGMKPPPSLFDYEAINKALFEDRKTEISELKRLKYLLINGEIRLARLELMKLRNSQSKLRPIIDRYAGILEFVDGKYEEAWKHFSAKELDSDFHFKKICSAKTLTRIILNKTDGLREDWSRCQLLGLLNLNPQAQRWMNILVDLKTIPAKGITRAPFERERFSRFEIDDLKLILKLALYLNQETTILPELTDLTLEQLRDEEVRELVGAIYFRVGSFVDSFKFVEDLTSPNAENIKGNLYILRKKYELAYAQFKLALNQKENSQNAMERLLPLAWVLQDWENGAKYSERVFASPQTQINKLTLLAAFLTEKGDYKAASEVLKEINQKSIKANRLEVTQLYSFVSMMKNEPEIMKKQAGRSCSQNDIINCWFLYQLSQWDAFPLTIKRKDAVAFSDITEKLTQSDIDEPLKENVYINQLDIEELDDKYIKLIPKSP